MNVLFGVFDWGLGHATRDSILIEALLKRGNKVDIISTGRALKLLQARFGKKCGYFDVRSVHVPYPENGFFMTKFAFHVPGLVYDLVQARKISREIIKKGKYDRVISDCRYDVFDKPQNSYLINHQLKFKAPKGIEYVPEVFFSKAMAKYGRVIVPDFPDRTLTKELSKNRLYKGKVEYIGILSHLNKLKIKEDIDYFISVSGPEPQRTVFERKVFEQVRDLKGKVVIACGKPECTFMRNNKNVVCHGCLSQKEQENIMNRAKFIISRSGYTTVMEIIELEKKKVLFVPTAGMTEQEYIADLYEEGGFFHHVHQNKMNLKEDIKEERKFKGYKCKWKTKESVNKFIKLIGA